MLLSIPSAWLAAYQGREQLLGHGLAVLGVWALLNLVVSGYQLPRTDRRDWPHHFHLMNCGWGFVNAVLAAVGIMRTHPGHPPVGLTPDGALDEKTLLVNIFLANAVLDVGYVLVGRWLLHRSTNPANRQPERLLGYGRSVQLQGAFLLVFDLAMWWLVRRG